MKKNEDTKRRTGGEKTVLKTGSWIKISLFLYLILSGIVYAQIPINGFCVKSSFQIPAGYDKILSADLNKDKIDELIIYSPSLKKIGIIFFVQDETIDLKEYTVEYEFSHIKSLNDFKKNNQFVCVSRKNRLIAVYEFKINSPPKLKSKITFDSYPENISVADINNDKTTEVLVSGVGFDGLSILFREEGRLAENKIISGESFSQAVFADLSGDGFTDVAAFNVINNSMQFYYNDNYSNFSLERTTGSVENINHFYSTDFNKDQLADLIYSSGKAIKILYGDQQSAYEKEQTLQTNYLPQILQSGDYNNDNLNDFAYVNNETGSVNLLFNKNQNLFYDEITFTNLPNISSAANYSINQQTNLAILSSEGILTTISSYKNKFKKTTILPSNKTTVVRKFDLNRDNISDLVFIDESDNSIRILTRNSEGIPDKFYSRKLAEPHRSIEVEDFFKKRKTFYCYSEEHQLIEFLRINFNTNQINHKQLYSPGKIKDLALQRVDSSLVNIYLLYTKENKLFLGRFEHRDLSITFKEYPFVDRDVICAELFLDKEIKAYYWKLKSDSIFLNEVSIKTGPNVYKGIAGLQKGDSIKITLAASNQLFSKKPWLISLVKNDDQTLLISFKENGYKKLHPLNEEFIINNVLDEQIVFSKFYNDENENPFIYLPELKTLNKLEILKDRKTYSLKRITGEVDINNYFIDKFNETNYHLVFSDSEKGSVSVLQLKK